MGHFFLKKNLRKILQKSLKKNLSKGSINSSFSSTANSATSSTIPTCIKEGTNPMVLLQWYLLEHRHLTSDRRKHYDDFLYRGGSLYIKCDDTGVLYVAEDDSNDQKHTNVGDWRKNFHQKQIQGRKNLREWTRSKQSVAISIKEQYTRQIQRMIYVHSTSTVVVIVRILDALETPLDPPRFGDVVLQYPNVGLVTHP